MEENAIYDLIIIGGGPAGLSAGMYAMRAVLKTALVEKGAFGGQVAMTKEVENYLGFESISGFELSERFLKHAESYGLELVRKEVLEVIPGAEHHTVILEDGHALRTHAIILATGSAPRRLNVPGEQEYTGKGVSYCATCDGIFFRDQEVIVVGGGDTATEEAIYLSKIAARVHVVHLEDSLRSSKILQKGLLSRCNIQIHSNSTLSRIIGDESGVTAVQIHNQATGLSTRLPAEGVFIFVGLSPNNRIVPAGVTLSADGYVLTNERRETSIPGIFAVGDIRKKIANQIAIAVGDGGIGALAAAHYVETKKDEQMLCELFSPAA